MFKIGTLADWFGVGLLKGIECSRLCGAEGVQLYALNELDPRTMTAARIAEVRKAAEDNGQAVTALCGEVGGHGLEIAADNPEKIDYLKRTLDLALELGCSVVTTHLGVLPEDHTLPKYAAMHSACEELSAYALSAGGCFAIETGPEPVAWLADFLKDCGPGMAVNYDPANLVMVTGDDEVEGVRTAGSLIVHTHAKDGVCNLKTTPEIFYGLFADGGVEALNASDYATEMPLGEGAVRWPAYLAALKSIGYSGFLTIEREVGGDAMGEISRAVSFLKNLLKTL
ncbi:sugar phosphate isomerase/epimerase [Oscillospiraceae bacterium OttesenSCG-928-F05]|nr:sugar phosphate isomerase/epimerase [Oscillospiraceae bacterium OttesenSCG-928-F05]